MSKKPRVCHLSSVHPALDTRIFYKECVTLVEAGYDVTLVARTESREEKNGVRIVPFPEYAGRYRRVLFAPFKMFSLAVKQSAEVYHFHDPELIITGVLLRLRGKKVVYDVHENVAKQILNKTWMGGRLLRKFASLFFRIIERCEVFFFHGVVAATPDIGKSFPSKKVTLVRNFSSLQLMDGVSPAASAGTVPTVIYAGVLTRIRGIGHAVEAMEFVENDCELLLAGKWEGEDFREECERRDGWRKVRYLGVLPLYDAYAVMKASDIGIVNFLPDQNHFRSLPNKAFEYMACSLPLIMSEFPYWKETFGDCALFADPLEPKDVARQIDRLIQNHDLRMGLGRAGRTLIRSEWSWESEKGKLLGLYRNLLSLTGEEG